MIVGGGMGSDSDSSSGSDEEYEGCGRDTEIMARESARRPVIRSGLSDRHSVEAKEMGKHLGNHLMSMRGGGFYDLFTKGIVEAGRQGASVAEYTGMPNPNSTPAATSDSYVEPSRINVNPEDEPPTEKKGSGAMFYRSGDMSKDEMEHHKEHTARRFGMTRKGGALKKFDFSKLAEKEPQYRTMEYTEADRLRDQRAVDRKPYMPSSDGKPPTRRSLFDAPMNTSKGGAMKQHSSLHKDSEQLLQRAIEKEEKLRKLGRSQRSSFGPSDVTTKGGFLSGKYEGMGMLGEDGHGQQRGRGKLTIIHGGTRSKAKPSKKEKSPYGRTSISEMSLGKMKKPKKAAVPPPQQPADDMSLLMDLPPPPKGKGRRAPAGPNDGRRARAEIVKRVMKEQGFKSMIEASKYVKDHGLYTGGGVGDKRKADISSEELRWNAAEYAYRKAKREIMREAEREAAAAAAAAMDEDDEEDEAAAAAAAEARSRIILNIASERRCSIADATKYAKDNGLI